MPEVRQAVLAHCVWLDPAVLDEVDFSRMTIAHNPKSNQKLGSGMMNLPGMMEKTRKIALGTDGAASNNRLDVWGEMRSAALVHQGDQRTPPPFPPGMFCGWPPSRGRKPSGSKRRG